MIRVFHQKSRTVIRFAELCRRMPPALMWPFSRSIGRWKALSDTRGRRQIESAFERVIRTAGLTASAHVLTKSYYEKQLMLLVAQRALAEQPLEKWNSLVRVEGFEPVKQRLDAGQGVVVCTMHFGAHILFLSHLAHSGHPPVPVRPFFMKEYDPALKRMLCLGDDVLFVGDTHGLASPLRQAVRVLKAGRPIGITPDGDQGGGATHVDLFSGKLEVRLGALEIARLARAPMVFMLSVFTDGKYLMRYFPVAEFSDADPPEETVQKFFEQSLRHYEETIRQFPDCVSFTNPMLALLGLDSKGNPMKESMQP